MIPTPRTLNLLSAGALFALTLPAAVAQSSDTKPADSNVKTYFLATPQPSEAQEILAALRNTLPGIRADLVTSKSALVVSAPPEQQVKVQQVIAELDRPRKIYRLTFTLADSDNGKRVGIQHISMVVAAGQRTVLKQGDKIPVVTGTYDSKGNTGTQTQFQYLDVGTNLDATLDDTPNGLQLKSKVEESSLGQPATIAGVQEPVVRQSVLEGTSRLTPGKPITLGSVDIIGTTRRIDIEVVAEPLS